MSTPIWRQIIEGNYDPFSSFDRRRSSGGGFEGLDTDWRAFQIEQDAASRAQREQDRAEREALELRGQEYVNLSQAQSGLERALGTAEALGQPDIEPKKPPAALTTIANVLDAAKSGVVGGLSGLMGWDIQGETGDTKFAVDRFTRQEDIVGNRNRLEVAWERALKGVFGGQSYGFGDFEALRYEQDDPRGQRVVRGLAAFALDVALDPLTYFSFGSSILGRVVASTGVRKVSQAVARETLEAAGEAAVRAQAERLGTRELAQRVSDVTKKEFSEALLRTPAQLVDDLIAAGGDNLINAATDAWSLGNAAAYGARGRTGLYDRLVETVGRDLADNVWSSFPPDIRGGARIRVPFKRTTDPETGLRLPTIIQFPGSQPGRGFDLLGMGKVVRKMNEARLIARTGPFKFLEHVMGSRGQSWTNLLQAARAGDGAAIEAYAIHFGSMVYSDSYRMVASHYDQAAAAGMNAIKELLQGASRQGLDQDKILDFVKNAYFKRGRADAPLPSSPEDIVGKDIVDRLFEMTNYPHQLAVEIYGEDAARKMQDYATRMLTEEGFDDLVERYGRLEGRRGRLAEGTGRDISSYPKSMELDNSGRLVVTEWMTPDEIATFRKDGKTLFITDPIEAVGEYMIMMRRELLRDWSLKKLDEMGLLKSLGEDVIRQPTFRKIISESESRMVKLRDTMDRIRKGESIPEVDAARLDADRAALEAMRRSSELVEVEPGMWRSADGLVEVRRDRSGDWVATVNGQVVTRPTFSQAQAEQLVPELQGPARVVDWDEVRRGFYDERGQRIPASQVRMEGTDDPRWITSVEEAPTRRFGRPVPEPDDSREISGTWAPWLEAGTDVDIQYVHKILKHRIATHEAGGRSVSSKAYAIYKRDLEILEELHPYLRGLEYDNAPIPASSVLPAAKTRIQVDPDGTWRIVDNVADEAPPARGVAAAVEPSTIPYREVIERHSATLKDIRGQVGNRLKPLKRFSDNLETAIDDISRLIRESYEAADQEAYSASAQELASFIEELLLNVKPVKSHVDLMRKVALAIQKQIEFDVIPDSGLGGARLPLEDRWRDAHPSLRDNPLVTPPAEDVVYRPPTEVAARLYDRIRKNLDDLVQSGDAESYADSLLGDFATLMTYQRDPYSAFAATLDLPPQVRQAIDSSPVMRTVIDSVRLMAEFQHIQNALESAATVRTLALPEPIVAAGARTVPGSWPRKDAAEVPTEWLRQFMEFDRAERPFAGTDYAALRQSIIDEGFNDPLILEIGLNGRASLVEGNHRLAIALELGLENVPVRAVVVTNVDDAARRAGRPPARVDVSPDVDSGWYVTPYEGIVDVPRAVEDTPNLARIGLGAPEAPVAAPQPGLRREFVGRYKYVTEIGEEFDLTQVRPEGKAQVWRVENSEGSNVGEFRTRKDAVDFLEGRPVEPPRPSLPPETRSFVKEINKAFDELFETYDDFIKLAKNPDDLPSVGDLPESLVRRYEELLDFLENSIELLSFDRADLARRIISGFGKTDSGATASFQADTFNFFSDVIENVSARAPRPTPPAASRPEAARYFGGQQYFGVAEGVGGAPTFEPVPLRTGFIDRDEAAYWANRLANRVREPNSRVVRDEVWERNRTDLMKKMQEDYEWLEQAISFENIARMSDEEFDTWVERVTVFLQGVDPSINPFNDVIDKTRYSKAAREAGIERFSLAGIDPVVAAIIRDNDLFGPEILAETIKRHFAAGRDTAGAEAFYQNFWRPYYTASKSWMTQGRGYGYTSRNIIGSMYNAWLADVRARHFKHSAALLAARRDAREKADEVLSRRGVQSEETTVEAWERIFDAELRKNLKTGMPGFAGMKDDVAELVADAYQLFTERNYGGRTARSRTWGDILDRGSFDAPVYGAGDVGLRQAELFPGRSVEELNRAQRIANATIDNPWMRHVTRVNESAEDYLRFAAFLRGVDTYGLDDGGFAAGSWVIGTQFDYSNLSDFERRVMKNIIPFYTWTRYNVPLQVRSLWMEPGKVARVLRFHEEVVKAWTGESKDENQTLPEWLQRRGGWMTTMTSPLTDPETALGQIFGLKEDPIAAFIESPLTDLGMLFNATLNPLQIINMPEVINNLNPIVGKTAYEFLTGRSYVSGRELDSDAPAPRWAVPYAALRGRRDEEGELVFSQKWANFYRNVAPPFAQIERLAAPLLGDERMRRRWLTTVGSQLLATPLYTVDPNQQAFAINQYARGVNEALKAGIINFDDKREVVSRLLTQGYSPEQIRDLGLADMPGDPTALNFDELARARRASASENEISTFLETLPPEVAETFIFRRGFRGLRGAQAVEAWNNRAPINELGALYLPEVNAAFSDWFKRLPESEQLGFVFQYGYGPYRGAEAVQRWYAERGLPNRPPGLGSADFLS